MVRIDCLIFGYRKIRIAPEDLSLLTSIFIRSAVFSSINADGTITVRERDFERIKTLLSGRIEFEFSEPLGLYGRWILLKNKKVIVFACIFSFILTLLLSGVVWDVRVSGNELLSEEEIVDRLNECGFGVGKIWIFSDKSRIETDLLSYDDSLSWVNINKRGTVAYVRVIERKTQTDLDDLPKYGYSNIVAKESCVIEEITVRRGVAVVKPGDVVKKGDLLVAGILPGEGGGGFCYADADVIGRVTDTVTVDLDRKYEKKEYVGSKTYSVALNFFDFSINIFKIYGKTTNEYDIIEDEIAYKHLDKYKLPFSVTVSYIPLFEKLACEYSDEEIVRLASGELSAMTNERLVGSDLVKITTNGNFTKDGYRISSHLIFLSSVGENVDFTAE